MPLFAATRESELTKTQEEKQKLAEKLQMLEGKLIVGGVDRGILVVNTCNILRCKVLNGTVQHPRKNEH